MPLAVHHNSEITKVFLAMLGIVVFVVIALTWVPELIAPGRRHRGPNERWPNREDDQVGP